MLKNILFATKIEKKKRLESIILLIVIFIIKELFANIYLNEIDQYAKHILKCKYYYRYMDDIVILCNNKEEAKERLQQLTIFLENKLKLTFNSKTRIFKNTQGVNFCGYKINSNVIKIRNSSKYRMKRKLKGYTKLLKSGKITLPEIQRSIAGCLVM